MTTIDPIEVQLERLKNLLGSGLDSDLERRVLDNMINMTIPLPDDAQCIITTKNETGEIYRLSSADLFYESKNLCVFIDGPLIINPK